MKKMTLYKSIQNNIIKNFEYIEKNYDSSLLEYILYPNRVLEFYIPVKMDDGSVKTFVWYRSQHNNAKWPYKGGIRFHQNVNKDEVMSLSAWMSLKTSVVGLPLWGGKWWIVVNPKELSKWELERLSRWFMEKLAPFIWRNVDVPAPDVNTNWEIMSWMADEYSKIIGEWTPWVITWKPIELWGSLWRNIATAQGWVFSVIKYLEMKSQSIKWKRIVIQWAWNAGLTFAELILKQGWIVIAISDSKNGIYNINWLDISEIKKLKSEKKSVSEYKNWEIISNKEILELECDILVPAALELVINKENYKNIRAELIVELANWPVDLEIDQDLFEMWIVVIPDILANAGWVTVSYFEQVQNNMNYYWTENEVLWKLKKIMEKSTEEVVLNADDFGVSLRDWAYILSIKRILDAEKFRK